MTTFMEDRSIIIISKRNRRLTTSEITGQANFVREKAISVSTGKRRLVDGGVKGYTAVRKPLLRTINRKKQLNRAKQYIGWTLEECQKVLWSDETKFEVLVPKEECLFVERLENG